MNPYISFTTMIKDHYEYIRVQNAQEVRRDNYYDEEIKSAFLQKDPRFIEKMGKEESPNLDAIIFERAFVTLNPVKPALEVHF